jgi:hypothetical protein
MRWGETTCKERRRATNVVGLGFVIYKADDDDIARGSVLT